MHSKSCADYDDLSIQILHLTDLYNSEFGKNNHEPIDRVVSQSPDLILITGDLLNSDEIITDIATNLISSLCDIAPVYISLGNHEMEYQDNFGVNTIELYQVAGAEVLEYQYEDITVNGQQLRLGGIYGYCLPENDLETGEADPEECAFLTEFQNTDLYTVLMCHIPVCWMINDGQEEWDMGWFPGRLKGIFSFETGNKVLVLSSGLGNTENILRFNNIPEIVVADLVPQSSK